MTEDKKKPEEDEVTDENLEQVSGGAMITSGSNAGGSVIPPIDVCMTPSSGGPVPTPYPNTSSDSGDSTGKKKVKTGSSGGSSSST